MSIKKVKFSKNCTNQEEIYYDRGKFYGDRIFIGDLGDHVYSAIKTL